MKTLLSVLDISEMKTSILGLVRGNMKDLSWSHQQCHASFLVMIKRKKKMKVKNFDQRGGRKEQPLKVYSTMVGRSPHWRSSHLWFRASCGTYWANGRWIFDWKSYPNISTWNENPRNASFKTKESFWINEFFHG